MLDLLHSLPDERCKILFAIAGNDNRALNVDGNMRVVICVDSLLNTVRHVASVAIGAVIVRGLSLSVVIIHRPLTMLVEERYTIRPDLMLLEVASDMNLMASSLKILGQSVVYLSVTILKLLLDANQLVLDLLKLAESLIALPLKVRKVSDAF